MTTPSEIKQIKKIVEEFFQAMTFPVEAEVKSSSQGKISEEGAGESCDTILIGLKIDQPQILIGENGQTLIEIQKILGKIIDRKMGRNFFVDLDINDYKKKKIEYLKGLAKDIADEVALTKREKVLYPMPAYERRIIHMELSNRSDVTTESRGEEPEREIVIKPR